MNESQESTKWHNFNSFFLTKNEPHEYSIHIYCRQWWKTKWPSNLFRWPWTGIIWYLTWTMNNLFWKTDDFGIGPIFIYVFLLCDSANYLMSLGFKFTPYEIWDWDSLLLELEGHGEVGAFQVKGSKNQMWRRTKQLMLLYHLYILELSFTQLI